MENVQQSVPHASNEPLIQTIGGLVQGTEVHVLPPLNCDTYAMPEAEVTQAARTSSAQARYAALRAAEQRALQETRRGIGDFQCAQAMQAASASADAAASTGTEVFGQRSQWRLRESLKRRRETPATKDPQAATYPPVTSQTPSSLTPVHVTAREPAHRDEAFADTNVLTQRRRQQLRSLNLLPHLAEAKTYKVSRALRNSVQPIFHML